MKKLTQEQASERMSFYDEIIDNINLRLSDNKIIQEQQLFIKKQIERIADKFYRKYHELIEGYDYSKNIDDEFDRHNSGSQIF